jgi:glutamine amidotransferase
MVRMLPMSRRAARPSLPSTLEVAVVDLGMGNLRSVLNAVEALGASGRAVGDWRSLRGADRIVLPGVGSFAEAMRRIRTAGWDRALADAVHAGRPLLGICLGMQLLAEWGTEGSDTPVAGLGFVPGTVRRLPAGGGARVPHVGWSDVEPVAHARLVTGTTAFYFVHSYALGADEGAVVATCDHGTRFAAVVEHGCVAGVQFHPEKSHRSGLALLAAFGAGDD